MTTDLVRIFRVDGGETKQPGLARFDIWAVLAANAMINLSLQTVNPYVASLCQRAKDLDKPITVRWERTRHGNTIREAHFIKTEAA